MSTASTVTTSVVRDLTPGNKLEITNCTCILVATQDNGFLFHPDSFQEEDVVELYIGLGQAHPEGVLWLYNTKTVLTFQSGSEMMATMCLFTMAMVWHDEPIKLYICQPTDAQISAYIAARGGHPSCTPVKNPGLEVISQSSPCASHPEEEPQPQLHLAIRDLDDSQLRQAMEELQWDAARREGTVPPLGSLLGQWLVPVGGVMTDLDDGEVTLQRGG